MIRLFVMMLVMCSTTAFAQSAPDVTAGLKKEIGGWEITEYYEQKSGKFTHCVASGDYNPATAENRRLLRSRKLSVMLKVLNDSEMQWWMIGWDWKLAEGKQYTVGFKFDGKDYFSVDMYARDEKALAVAMPMDDSAWIQKMMHSNDVEFFIDNQTLGSFRLTDSKKAILELLSCWFGNMKKQEDADPTFGGGSVEPDQSFGGGR